ncbi:MAG: glycosyltransferase, partial [Patescibacteria group bacterium]
MKILFTGGGSGGHFYPIIAIVQELNKLIDERKLVAPKYYYMSDNPYDEKALFEYNIEFKKISAGKLRIYSSIKNIFDIPRTGWGIIVALWKLFLLFPDVIVGKGGYASFPVIVAARLLRIPVIVHESDAIPGRVNKFAGKFAKRIGIAYEEALEHFPKDRTALVGIPIRRELTQLTREGAYEYLKLERDIPTILIVGGSQGAQMINDVVLDILPDLLNKYQIIHQVGMNNMEDIKERLTVIINNHEHISRYKM